MSGSGTAAAPATPGGGLRGLRAAATTAVVRTVSDRGSVLVSVSIYTVVVIALGSLWRAAVDARGGPLAGYTGIALSWYIATSEAGTVSLNSRMIEEIGDAIVSGQVAAELLRPASVVAIRIATEVGRVLPRLAVFAAVGISLTWALAGRPPAPAGLVLAGPSLVLAVSCNIAAQHAFAAAAFWIRDIRTAWFLYQKLVFVVGGMLIPLEVLPPALERAGKLSPFMAMAYAPARLASGHPEPLLLVVQVGWLAVLLGAARLTFAAGERRLQVVGG